MVTLAGGLLYGWDISYGRTFYCLYPEDDSNAISRDIPTIPERQKTPAVAASGREKGWKNSIRNCVRLADVFFF